MTHGLSGTLLLDPVVIEDPYPFYRQLQSQAPVWQVPGTDVFVVSSFAAVAEATARVEDFSSNMACLLYRGDDGLPERLSFGEFTMQTLATADPPAHTVHRNTVFPELVAKRMSSLEPEIVDLALGCVKRAVELERVDFMAEIGNVIPIAVISRLIGFRDSDPERLLRAAFESTAMLGSTVSLERLVELVAGVGEIEAWIADQLRGAASDRADTILGSVARGIDDGVLAVQEGTIILHTLLSAGGESTTSVLGSAVRILAEQPDLQERLRKRPELVPAFVEEALRLESPFRYLMRSAVSDTSLAGEPIPAGATVLLFWGAANRDPAEYEHPDDVDLDRRVMRHHVAFGRGIHHCVGAPLARLEAQIVLRVLLDRTSDVSLDPERPPRWVDSLLIRRYEQLPVRLAG
ncbi:MAG: cytochrome P450 [Acidimicrobiia bacterium]